MKRALYFFIIAAFIGSCSTSKKTTTVSTPEPAPVPPAGITFTQVENYKDFKTIYMPFEGVNFDKKNNHPGKNDAGEEIPMIKYKGAHVYQIGDLSTDNTIRGDKATSNAALESIKNSYVLRPLLKKDNVVEHYSDVVIAGKTCKKFLVSSNFSRDDYSCVYYRLGYIIPHHNTTALFYIDSARSNPIAAFEGDIQELDSAFKYMIETVEFREYENL